MQGDEKGKYARQRRYKASHKVTFRFDLYDTNSSEMIQWLKDQPNLAGYLKRLIQEDMDTTDRRIKEEDEPCL